MKTVLALSGFDGVIGFLATLKKIPVERGNGWWGLGNELIINIKKKKKKKQEIKWATFCDISQIPGAGGSANMSVYGDLYYYPRSEQKGGVEKDKAACIDMLHSFIGALSREVSEGDGRGRGVIFVNFFIDPFILLIKKKIGERFQQNLGRKIFKFNNSKKFDEFFSSLFIFCS